LSVSLVQFLIERALLHGEPFLYTFPFHRKKGYWTLFHNETSRWNTHCYRHIFTKLNKFFKRKLTKIRSKNRHIYCKYKYYICNFYELTYVWAPIPVYVSIIFPRMKSHNNNTGKCRTTGQKLFYRFFYNITFLLLFFNTLYVV
jgi:hypothetical protein